MIIPKILIMMLIIITNIKWLTAPMDLKKKNIYIFSYTNIEQG